MHIKSLFSAKQIIPLFFAIFIDILSVSLVYPLLTGLFTSTEGILSANDLEAVRLFYLSLSFLLAPLFMFFGAPFIGDLSDMLGRKKMLLICMGGLFLSFALMGIAVKVSSVILLLAARALSGLMSGSMPTALAAISDLSTFENKAVHMSFIALVQSFGFVFGPFLGGIFSDQAIATFFNFSLPFFGSAALAIIAFIWIWAAFRETFVVRPQKKLDPRRIYQIFIEVYRHPKIRLLSCSFLLMQLSVTLYYQLILIYYKIAFDYSSFAMGLFNAFLGLWFAVGLIAVVPYAAKRFKVEWITFICFLLSGIFLLFVSFIPYEIFLWLIVIPMGITIQVGFVTLLASFSNAADVNSQGWAMGITGSLIALGYLLTGLSPNLVTYIGVKIPIFIGALFMLFAGIIMGIYYRRYLRVR